MNSTDLETIRAGLAGVWDTQGRKFVTFERTGRAGAASGPWIQFLDGELNVEWLRDDNPAVVLAARGVRLPRGAFVSWFAPNANAVIGLGDARIDETAACIAALFEFLGGAAAGPLAARIDAHG